MAASPTLDVRIALGPPLLKDVVGEHTLTVSLSCDLIMLTLSSHDGSLASILPKGQWGLVTVEEVCRDHRAGIIEASTLDDLFHALQVVGAVAGPDGLPAFGSIVEAHVVVAKGRPFHGHSHSTEDGPCGDGQPSLVAIANIIAKGLVNHQVSTGTGTKVGHTVAGVVVPHHADEGCNTIGESAVHAVCVIVEEGSGTSTKLPSALVAKVHLLGDHWRLCEDTGEGGEDGHKVSKKSKEIEEAADCTEETEHEHDDGCHKPQNGIGQLPDHGDHDNETLKDLAKRRDQLHKETLQVLRGEGKRERG